MSDVTLDAAAKALYDACPTPKPNWEQIGETTKDTWREAVQQGTTLLFGVTPTRIIEDDIT